MASSKLSKLLIEASISSLTNTSENDPILSLSPQNKYAPMATVSLSLDKLPLL